MNLMKTKQNMGLMNNGYKNDIEMHSAHNVGKCVIPD